LKYAEYTRNTSEPLKRIAHGRRFAQVVSIATPLQGDSILDYGCGDGHLFSHFVGRFNRAKLVGYDPDPKLLAEAAPEVAAGSVLTSDVDALQRNYQHTFSLIYCMEVCEHLTDKALGQLVTNIRELSAPQATIIFGVPIETGPSGFLKSIYRMAHGGRQGASIANAFKALFGLKINRQTTDVEWYGAHTGFNHSSFRLQLESSGFKIRKICCLPFPTLGTVLNNEIYYVCSIK
jgi:SAM-dependent methyltransferase